jgi:predicted lipoprotein with Yx(FWY)xxD motif
MHISIMRTVAAGAFAALALAACGSSSKSSDSSSNTTQAPAATTTAPAAATGSATVSLASVTNPDVGSAKVLVDSKGMTLYVYDKDSNGKSNCNGVCAQNWPPVPVTGSETYASGLSASMFSTITRDDGTKQLAVNGKPLYTWVNDKKAGDATGQGVNSFYVVGVNGQKIDKD